MKPTSPAAKPKTKSSVKKVETKKEINLTVPDERPKIDREEFFKMLKAQFPDFEVPDFFICGIRGYYQDSMGEVGKNDRGVYDDAIFLVGKDEFISFNGNTDPSVFKLSIASLNLGIYPAYKFDLHKGQYLALCQRGANVTVTRDGKGIDTGMFGINIHKGGRWGTSSLGCQTVPTEQWDEFINKALALGKKYYDKSYRSKCDYVYALMKNQPTVAKQEAPIAL